MHNQAVFERDQAVLGELLGKFVLLSALDYHVAR